MSFGPLKGSGGLVVDFNAPINGLLQLAGGSKAGSFERGAGENAEPALDLVQLAGVCRGVVKLDVR